jgi:poly(3-hydroxybutyrate) depolymerase
MLYQLYEFTKYAMMPGRAAAGAMKNVLSTLPEPFVLFPQVKAINASCEIFERLTHQFGKPDFNIANITIDDITYVIEEHIIAERPFCDLLHFKKINCKISQPKVLLVAPMSGHHATLLRDTVRGLLPFCDVYITDWLDAREIPLKQGNFDFDDQIHYVIEFTKLLGPNVHVIAVCQPVVQVLAAASIMSTTRDKARPKSIVLMGGPVDTRINPGPVNQFAKSQSLAWFENMMITTVPAPYPGAGRKVYPGFLQIAGFISLHPERHVSAHLDFFNHLIAGDDDSATAHRRFYDEYLSVMDLTAEFFLESIQKVFLEHHLPSGTLTWKNLPVNPADITDIALLTIEGERDDISPPGQSEIAHQLCKNIPDALKMHILQKDVGHYGIFNGRKWRNFILPQIIKFITTVSPQKR